MSAITEKEVDTRIREALPASGCRLRLMELFISSIREANEYGRQGWAVSSDPRQIRLIVGHLIVATLECDSIWLSLDRKGMSEVEEQALTQAQDWEWSSPDEEYSEYHEIPAKNGYYTPAPDAPTTWPLIRNLHYNLIFKAAHGRVMDPRTPANHSPSVLSYLRNSMGVHVPDPLYAD